MAVEVSGGNYLSWMPKCIYKLRLVDVTLFRYGILGKNIKWCGQHLIHTTPHCLILNVFAQHLTSELFELRSP